MPTSRIQSQHNYLMPFLPNKNISLRALEKEDIHYLYDIENKSSAREFGESLMPLSKHVLQSFIENADKDIYTTRQLRMVIEHNDSCEAIGMIDLYDYHPHHKRAGVGIWIDEEQRRKGYASEAIESLCHYAFDVLMMHQLFCYISLSNKKSVTLFKKNGFTQSGTLKDWHLDKTGYSDVLLLQKTTEK